MILDTDNPNILSSVKRIFSTSQKIDFWDNLTQSQQEEILQGIEEIEKENNTVLSFPCALITFLISIIW